MQIDFCEEFPTKKNLDKLKFIKFKSTFVVAAKSIREYKKIKVQVNGINPLIKCAYWPIIPNSYWISPFSNTEDLVKTFNELDKIKDPVLIDLELPFKGGRLILKNIFSFIKNKKIIRQFLHENKKRVITAVFPTTTFRFFSAISRLIGLDYNVMHLKSIMFYTSMIPKRFLNLVRSRLGGIKNKDSYIPILGTIDIGIGGDEPILHPMHLKRDLDFVRKIGFKRVAIFKLSGLNKEYMKVINKFAR